MRVNDLVTRKSHNNDIIFKIIEIKNDVVYLKGEVIRLTATAKIDDLVKVDKIDQERIPNITKLKERNALIPGTILHIDGDEHYLKRAMEAYHEYNVPVIGCYINEKHIDEKIESLLYKHRPDIVVITGHDALQGSNIQDINSYRHSFDFVKAILKIREYQSNKDSLIIIAGACQSHYEALLKAGANVASSPTRENIHLLDPVIVAALLAKSPVSEYTSMRDILNSTITKKMGGIETKGVARRIYTGGK